MFLGMAMLLGALLTPCNIYSGLKIGWSFNISIIALLLASAFWAVLARLKISRHLGADEANITRTVVKGSDPFVALSARRG